MTNEENAILLDDIRLATAAPRDRDEAERLFKKVAPKIHEVLHATISDPVLIEDIRQTVALQVMKSLSNFRGQGPIEAWVGQITFRTAMRYMKRYRNMERISAEFDEAKLVVSKSPETDTGLQEVFSRLKWHLRAMPRKRRTPLLLHFAYGYTVKEISEIVGAPVNTVKGHIKEALKEIRTILRENPELKSTLMEVIS